MSTPLAGKVAEPGWGPWTPGVRLMRRIPSGVRLVLMLALALLPALPWLSPSVRLSHVWLPLLAVALYGWVCAVLAARSGEPAVALAAAAESRSPAAPAHAEPGLSSLAPQPPTPLSPEPGPGATAMTMPEPADFRVGCAEVRGATDEISRRVVGTSGLLDASSKAAADALADIEALHDEDRHAQKLLSALRGRMLQLEQRCHGLVRAALPSAQGEQGAAQLNKQLQAVEALLLHVHQLAERLGAVEHQHGARMESLRRSVERVDGYSERGLREAQQILQLTRRVFSTLDAAEQDLLRVEVGGGAHDA